MTDLYIPEPTLCGLGEGEDCCAFLMMGVGGFKCGRMMDDIAAQVRFCLAVGTMKAKYDPGSKPFPRCQIERKGEAA